ncbi:MAG: hypothetical protein ABH863_04130, partial [Candidatus Micrarchaeota archaeon]
TERIAEKMRQRAIKLDPKNAALEKLRLAKLKEKEERSKLPPKEPLSDRVQRRADELMAMRRLLKNYGIRMGQQRLVKLTREKFYTHVGTIIDEANKRASKESQMKKEKPGPK